ncbi:hypothetical protein CDAR_205671 [Caerostris darwini]|uniref:Uncharacterized protein n=1 Tax=Caerostris darwini TaxID=1538125 RepID=A0AAV4WRW0_9ARAC|nr:hypothetical protein CDAR_205671 [Caerostris darwini]
MTAFRLLPDTLQSLGSFISLPFRGAQLHRSSGFAKLLTIDRNLELEKEINKSDFQLGTRSSKNPIAHKEIEKKRLHSTYSTIYGDSFTLGMV